MSLDQAILDIVKKKLEDGTATKIIEEEFVKGVQKAMGGLFSSYGDVTKVIESKIKEVMVPFLENHDYQEYIVKLDSVLQDVLKSTTLENKNLLENFKHLMASGGQEDMKVTDLFEMWKDFVCEKVDTNGLDIDYDDSPSYECVDVNYELEEGEEKSWTKYKSATIVFTCEHDEKMNVAIPIHTWEDIFKDKWYMDYKTPNDIKGIRYLNEFEILLMKMTQFGSKIILDKTHDDDSIRPDAEPEATFE